jgi:hypothetical protein
MACGSSLYNPTENTCLSLKVAPWPVWALLMYISIRTFRLICMILTYMLIILTLASEYMRWISTCRTGDRIWRQVTNLGTHSLFLGLNYPMNVNILGGTLTIILNVVANALSREPCSLNALLKTSQPTLCEEFERFILELVSHWFLANLEV